MLVRVSSELPRNLFTSLPAPCISVCLQLYKQTLCDIKTKQKKGIPIFPRQVVPPPSETSSQLLVRKTKVSVLAISESLHT